MGHVALYRKYRPVTFNDCRGQDHIRITLTNQIKAGRVSHAYLFTGSRGTGKTTFARIFAKAINCQKPVDGSPCEKCKICIELNSPNSVDILEIDAASNRGVDDIRDLRERVKYLPVHGQYKVYIVDEVHMLTQEAFNALLKTLEEPPAHVVFILATTEAYKLPATILSRCMRFDFRLVGKKELVELLSRVLSSESKNAELAAIGTIADAAAGSFRDALSILDMCLHISQNKLTQKDVLSVLGTPDKEKIAQLFTELAAGDLGAVLSSINNFILSGKSMPIIAKDVANFSRDVLALKLGLDALVTGTSELIESMKALAAIVSEALLLYSIQEFSRIDLDLKYSTNPRILLESVALKAARLKQDDALALAARLDKVEARVDSVYAGGVAVGNKIPQPPVGDAVLRVVSLSSDNAGATGSAYLTKTASEPLNPHPPTPDPPPISLPVQKISDVVKQALDEDAKSIWGRLITAFRKKGQMQIFTLLGEHSDYRLSGRDLIVTATSDNFLLFSDEAVKKEITTTLAEIGAAVVLKIEKKQTEIDMDAEIANAEKIAGFKPKIKK